MVEYAARTAPPNCRLLVTLVGGHAVSHNPVDGLPDLVVTAGCCRDAEEQRMIELDERRRRYPSIQRLLPTRLGNRIRAAEDEPKGRYGLDAVLTWGYLWLLLPETARAELVAARSALDRAVAGIIWSALFILFLFWTPWAIPVSVLSVLLITLIWLPAQADRYAALILTAFDLYKAARWPLPATPDDELRTGPLPRDHPRTIAQALDDATAHRQR